MAEDPFLSQIESFGLPPPEKKLIDDETVVPTTISTLSHDLARRINHINIQKQKQHLRSDVIVPAGGMVEMAASQHDAQHEEISRDQVDQWKTQVLSSNRPRNQWSSTGERTDRETAVEESRAYARSIAAQMNNGSSQPIIVRTAEHNKTGSSSTLDEAVSSDSYPSPSDVRRPIKGATGDSDKYSDYSSASSHKSPSPPQTSPTSSHTTASLTSDYSVSTSTYNRPSDYYRTAPAEVYRGILTTPSPGPLQEAARNGGTHAAYSAGSTVSSGTGSTVSNGGSKKVPPAVPKKTVTIVPGAIVVPLPADKRPQVPVYHGGLRSQTRSANYNPLKLPMDTSNYEWRSSDGRRSESSNWREEERPAEWRVPVMNEADPAVRGVVRVVVPSEKKEQENNNDRTRDSEETEEEILEARRRKWRELAAAVDGEEPVPTLNDSSRKSSSISLTPASSVTTPSTVRHTKDSPIQSRPDVLHQQPFAARPSPLPSSPRVIVAAAAPPSSNGPIVVPAKAPSASVVGDCGSCHGRVLSSEQAVAADGQLFHAGCFICSVCKRNLRDRKHVSAKGRLFCQDDYRYTGANETTERCAKCQTPIVDMVLQALGRYFHPACFRCVKCRICLDGVPFALDTKGEVYCMADYHELFAPRCASCSLPILPDPATGETVRVVAINNDYHVDCYVCEGCNTRLTDASTSKCYPLGQHLLCYDCHLLWRRTGGDAQPITDL